jgi:crossover junction endodeoxyribonuclease RuvC
MNVIGIDPGLSGGIAMLDAGGVLIAVGDLPVMRSDKLAWIDGGALRSWILHHKQTSSVTCVVERVSAMPKQGVSSSFQFGVGFGSILGALRVLDIPIHLVTPGTWKGAMKLKGKDKRAALDQARLLYPTAELHLAKHDGRAEALLVALWHLQFNKGAIT